MSIPLTLTAQLTSQQINLQPQIIFTIDGVPTKFAASTIYEFIRIGDAGLYIDNYLGDPWYIGGLRRIEDQVDYISFQNGTTTKINQQLQPDKGVGTSVTQLTIAMIDKNEEISEIVSPGFVVSEILGRNCRVQIGFANNAYPEDYITIFRGIVETVNCGAGLIKFQLSSSEQKKRQFLFERANGKLVGSISSGGAVSSINLTDASAFKYTINGPTGSPDSTITYYARIDDEWFSYTGVSGNTLTGVTRNPPPFNFGQASHDPDAEVNGIVRLQGAGMDIARKLMLSGVNNYFLTGVGVENFGYIDPVTPVANSVFFYGVNIKEEYGLTVGDYITTSGASNGANNFTLKTISDIVVTNDGSYVVVNGVSIVAELNTGAVASFRSQWDTLGWGCGMIPNDVDLDEWEKQYRLFLSGFNFDFRVKEGFDVKEFMEQQILRPMTAFSIQRKGKISIGLHTPPLPNVNMITADVDNVENASKLVISRSIVKNFYNVVNYQLDIDPQEDKYTSVKTTKDQSSIDDFNNREIPINIMSDGLRTTTGGLTVASTSSARLLNRYKRAAEYIDNIEIRLGDAFNAEIGDNMILDLASLQLTDVKSGNRNGDSRIVQIIQKSFDLKTGKIVVGIVDTKFSGAARYGLISPASNIQTVASAQQFVLASSHASVYGVDEWRKWQRFGNCIVRVRNDSGSDNNLRTIASLNGNTVTLATPLSFTPVAGVHFMEFANYNNQTDAQKLAYASMRNVGPFDDGDTLFNMV